MVHDPDNKNRRTEDVMQGTSAAVPSARPGKIGGMIGSMARNLLALALLEIGRASCRERV